MSKLNSILRRPHHSRAVTLGVLFTCVLVMAVLLAPPLSGETSAEQQGAESESASTLRIEYAPRTRTSLQGLDVCGDIAADATWTIANSPMVLTCHVTIKTGATLTIEPGVVVKFEGGMSLYVGQYARVVKTSSF